MSRLWDWVGNRGRSGDAGEGEGEGVLTEILEEVQRRADQLTGEVLARVCGFGEGFTGRYQCEWWESREEIRHVRRLCGRLSVHEQMPWDDDRVGYTKLTYDYTTRTFKVVLRYRFQKCRTCFKCVNSGRKARWLRA